MNICRHCERPLTKNENRVLYREKEGGKFIRVHLECFIDDRILPSIDRAGSVDKLVGNTNAGVSIDAEGLCPWCRRDIPAVVMHRTGQAICLKCLLGGLELLSSRYRRNTRLIEWRLANEVVKEKPRSIRPRGWI